MIKASEQYQVAFLSMIEPNNFEESSEDEYWIRSINEVLDQDEKNNTWEFVPRPIDKNLI